MEYAPELFRPAGKDHADDVIVRPSLTYWQDAWRRLRRNKTAMTALVFLVLLFVACIVIPFFYAYTYDEQIRTARNLPMWSAGHIFGTDSLGRDLFIRLVYGARISLLIGIVGALVDLTIGVLYGGLAGYIGGKVEMIMMRIIEILDSIPLLLYVILLGVVFKESLGKHLDKIPFFRELGSQIIVIFIVLGLVYWVTMARIVRGQVLAIKNQEFVMAARSQGAGTMRIIWRHLVPNAIGQIIVTTTMAIPTAIFAESFLSFLGLGVAIPMASWGSLASEAYSSIGSYPHRLILPAVALSVTMLAFNLLGDGLRDALDPRLRK